MQTASSLQGKVILVEAIQAPTLLAFCDRPCDGGSPASDSDKCGESDGEDAAAATGAFALEPQGGSGALGTDADFDNSVMFVPAKLKLLPAAVYTHLVETDALENESFWSSLEATVSVYDDTTDGAMQWLVYSMHILVRALATTQ